MSVSTVIIRFTSHSAAADSSAPSSLYQTTQFATHQLGESGDDFAESRKRLVDVGSFLEPGALCSRTVSSLAARQVHQADFTHLQQQTAT